MSLAKYAEREQIVDALDEAGVASSTQSAILDAYDAANPSAFVNSSGLPDENIASAALKILRTHVRRFPKSNCALAVSLKDLFVSGNTTYQP